MTKIKAVLDYAISELEYITDNARFESELLIEALTDYTRLDLIINSNEEILDEKFELIKEKINKRKSGYPLQYILGSQEFMGLEFKVNENVLIPRQDTEILIETILEKKSEDEVVEILDIGTGSGAISISLAYFLKNSKVTSVDISEKAIEVAKENAKINDVEHRINFIKSDIFQNVDEKKRFGLIVSNPPYIPSKDIETLQSEVKDFEPMLALDGGDDGLDFYKIIIEQGVKYLAKFGILAFEVGHDQAQVIKSIMEKDYKNIEIYKDLPGIERVVIGIKK